MVSQVVRQRALTHHGGPQYLILPSTYHDKLSVWNSNLIHQVEMGPSRACRRGKRESVPSSRPRSRSCFVRGSCSVLQCAELTIVAGDGNQKGPSFHSFRLISGKLPVVAGNFLVLLQRMLFKVATQMLLSCAVLTTPRPHEDLS